MNLDTLINWMRQVIGEPDFYKQLTGTSNYTWDYGSMIEYVLAGLIVLVVISNIFKCLRSGMSGGRRL